MKILFLTTSFPFPPNDGERVRSYNLLCQLSRNHEVTLVTFFDDEVELAGVPHLLDLGLDVFSTFRAKFTKFGLFKSVLGRIPFFVSRNGTKEFGATIARLVHEKSFDAVHLDGLPLVQYFSLLPTNVKVVFDLRDSWTVLYKRKFQNSIGVSKLINWFKWRVVSNYERRALSLPVTPVLLSSDDKKALVQLLPNLIDKIELIPNGVDTDYFTPETKQDNNLNPSIVFTGSMEYAPNAEAVEYFVRNIWKYVLEKFPTAKFCVVGKKPGPNLLKLNSSSVSIVGEVKDLRPYINNSDLVVCPLLSGAGIKNKVLEAMALGKAVISTPIGVEGIFGENGTHYIVCSDDQSFISNMVLMIESRDRRVAIGKAARSFIESRFCWRSSTNAFEKLYAGKN